MNNAVIKKSTLRSLVRTLLEDKALGPAMINVNPVVDPSAPLVDPSNTDFVPTNSSELKAAVSAMVTGLPDESIPDVYDSIKQALEAAQEEVDMKDEDSKIEEALRRTVRKLIKEALPKLPSKDNVGPGLQDPDPAKYPTRDSLIKYYRSLGFKTAEATSEADYAMKRRASPPVPANFPIKKFDSGVSKFPVAQKPSDEVKADIRDKLNKMFGADEERKAGGKKNIMGDKTLEDIAAELAAQGEKGTSISNIKKSDILGTEKLKQRIDTRVDDVALSDQTVDKIASKVQADRIDDSHTQDIIAASATAENLPEGSPERRQARIDFVQSIADLMNKLLDTTFSVRDITQADLKVRQSENTEDYDNLEDLMSLLNQTSDLNVAKELLNNFILSIAVAASVRV